jgi:hypothetical protein
MQRFRKLAADLCLGLGVVSVIYGVSLVSRAAAFVVSGVALLGLAWVLAQTERREGSKA